MCIRDSYSSVVSQTTIFQNNDTFIVNIQFNSSADDSSMIFGGLLDRCTLDPYAEVLLELGDRVHHSKNIDGVTYLKMISNTNESSISSSPVRLYFCTHNKPNCSREPHKQVMRGESFSLSLVAVDQVNHTVPNVAVYSSFNHTQSLSLIHI